MSHQKHIENPSVQPHTPFKPVDDVHALRAAMKGAGTDEKALISIICRRTNEQLQIIQTNYKSQLGRDLLEDVRSETSGHFREVLCALLAPRYKFYVKQLHGAIKGMGTNEDTLIEILCSMAHQERAVVQANYLKDHKKSLEDAIKGDTSGTFQRLLTAMCFVKREETMVNQNLAKQEAQDLINWPKVRSDADEFLYNRVMTQRSFAHIRAIDEHCQQMGTLNLEGLVAKHFSGDVKNCLTAIVRFALDRVAFFAQRLHMSMAGLGTSDSQLIRLMVMRCEVDLADVSKRFEILYGKTLVSFIKGDTSGYYQHALLTLLNEGEEE